MISLELTYSIPNTYAEAIKHFQYLGNLHPIIVTMIRTNSAIALSYDTSSINLKRIANAVLIARSILPMGVTVKPVSQALHVAPCLILLPLTILHHSLFKSNNYQWRRIQLCFSSIAWISFLITTKRDWA
jgi:hypothetical protein